MEKNVFIVNGHQYWEFAPGKLNRTLVEFAAERLKGKGYNVRITHIDDGYDHAEEVDSFVWANVMIYQFPVYWFSIPWGMKKYIDEVYMSGRGKIFDDDGRTRSDPTRKYGSGGRMMGRKYMLSTTWNAPSEAFGNDDQMFKGKDVDDVFFALHMAQKFVGFEPLPTFSCYDVKKSPDIDAILQGYAERLDGVL